VVHIGPGRAALDAYGLGFNRLRSLEPNARLDSGQQGGEAELGGDDFPSGTMQGTASLWGTPRYSGRPSVSDGEIASLRPQSGGFMQDPVNGFPGVPFFQAPG
jgi:hypothetical protein